MSYPKAEMAAGAVPPGPAPVVAQPGAGRKLFIIS